jgi:hypothetical protein
VEIVLGVSMTPTTVSIALVEGEKADGVIVEHDVFEITAIDGSATSSAPDHVIAAVLGTQEGAISAGHHLVSTGVTWTDHAQAAVLREALVAHDIEDVLLVSELHAAAALAQTVGRAVGYDKTALMFIERDTATLAVVETTDGSVTKVRSQSLHGEGEIAGVAKIVTDLDVQDSVAQGLFVVGSGVDVTAIKAHLKDLVSVPVIAPEEPQLALARGAALASANAPRYDASTIGLAYSQDPDETTVYPMAPADDATTFLGHDDASADTADLASDPDDVPERSKPSMLMASSLTAIFVAGVTAMVIAMVINIQPTAEQGSGATTVRPSAVAPPVVPSASPPAPKPAPTTVPEPAPAAPPSAAAATARLMIPPPPPPPRVVVRNAAPAPAAPPPAPAAPPPPVVIPPPAIQWLPPILQPPPWYPGWTGPPWGRGGSRNGHDDHGDDDDHGGRRGHGGDDDGD